jgi:ADP-heptose:LPS heptosyltransferase
MSPRASKMLIPVILSVLKSGHNRPGSQFSAEKATKVLLVKQSERLGNIVLMNSAIAGLAARYPHLKIDLLLPAPYAEVMGANSYINKIIPVYKREYIVRPWKLSGLIRTLKRCNYDLAIDCSDVNSHSSTGAAYTLLSAARLTAGWKMFERQVFDIEIERYTEIVHASQMYQKLFSGIFGGEIDGKPYFNNIYKTGSLNKTIIGINCGGRGSKRWPLEKFIEVGKILSAQGFEIEFILGPEENNLRGGLNNNLPTNCHLLLQLSLPDLMKVMSSYKAFISSYTGPMHLAWCLKIPTIAIFLDSELDKFKPLSPGSVAIDGQRGVEPKEVADLAANIVKSGRVTV